MAEKTLVERMRNLAEDHERHEQGGGASSILYEGADEIARLLAAMLTAASILERGGDEHGVGSALRRAMTPPQG